MDGAVNPLAHSTVVKEISPWKMWSPKSVMLAGIFAVVSSVRFWKALSPMEVTFSSMTISTI